MSFSNPEINLTSRPARAASPSVAGAINTIKKKDIWAAAGIIEYLLPESQEKPSEALTAKLRELRAIDKDNIGDTGITLTIDEIILSSPWPKLRRIWIKAHCDDAAHSKPFLQLMEASLATDNMDLAITLFKSVEGKETRVPAGKASTLMAHWARSANEDNAFPVLMAMRPIFDKRMSDQGFAERALDHAAVEGSRAALDAVIAFQEHVQQQNDGGGFSPYRLADAFDQAFSAMAPEACERLLDFALIRKRFQKHAEPYGIMLFKLVSENGHLSGEGDNAIFNKAGIQKFVKMATLVAIEGQASDYIQKRASHYRPSITPELSAALAELALDLGTPRATSKKLRGNRL